MSLSGREKAEAFKSLMEEKIRALIVEFAEGKISREQFHALYERYDSRLQIATEALITGNPDAVEIAMGGPPTIAVRSAVMGRALGVLIYHHISGTIVETLGEFDVPVEKLSPVLNDFSLKIDANEHVERMVTRIDGRHWLLYNPGRFCIVVTLFMNEPSQVQMREISRLHHDFEVANEAVLNHSQVDNSKLGYPFVVFVEKKFGSK